jgi:hypothetical protein
MTLFRKVSHGIAFVCVISRYFGRKTGQTRTDSSGRPDFCIRLARNPLGTKWVQFKSCRPELQFMMASAIAGAIIVYGKVQKPHLTHVGRKVNRMTLDLDQRQSKIAMTMLNPG